MRYRSLVGAALVLALPSAAAAQTPALNAPVALKTGDVAVFVLDNMLRVRQDLSDPAIVTYEPDPGIIDIEIFGGSGNVERAKNIVAQHWEFIRAIPIPYIQRRFSVQLTEKSFRIMYYERASPTPKLILSFVGGQYIMAP
jgi:hypothetical protein